MTSQKKSDLLCGQRFGNLIALLDLVRDDQWYCRCDCGHSVVATRQELESDEVTSCYRCK